jgi:DNA-binding response OmpR family regulator
MLVVEDDSAVRNMLIDSFTREGHRVFGVADGAAALDYATTDRFDVVILDVALGQGPDGHEVCRMLRERRNVVPVIMLTALDSEADAVLGLEAGADDYVKKPFEVPELVARVRAALRRAGHAQDGDQRLRLGPLNIDVAGRTAERDGRDVPLTRTEFDLLVELARRPGQVLTRDVLLDHVWGYDYLGDSRLVDVAMQRLRAKVEADAANPELLLTVRGAGYKAAR